jgi:hypothetical protein
MSLALTQQLHSPGYSGQVWSSRVFWSGLVPGTIANGKSWIVSSDGCPDLTVRSCCSAEQHAQRTGLQ